MYIYKNLSKFPTNDGKYGRKQVSILRYSSENPHHEFHIHKLVTYFDVFRLSDFEFFWFLRHLPVSTPFFRLFLFQIIIIIFFVIFGHYSSVNTKYRYLNKVSIIYDTKRYRCSIDSINTISYHYFPLLLRTIFFQMVKRVKVLV